MTFIDIAIVAICMAGAAFCADRSVRRKMFNAVLESDAKLLKNLEQQGMIEFTAADNPNGTARTYNIKISHDYLNKIYSDAELQFICRGVKTGLFSLEDLSRITGTPVESLQNRMNEYETRLNVNQQEE